jgi:dipeptidyl-peptidase-4
MRIPTGRCFAATALLTVLLGNMTDALAASPADPNSSSATAVETAYRNALRFAPYLDGNAVRGAPVWRWIGNGEHLWHTSSAADGSQETATILETRTGRTIRSIELKPLIAAVAEQTGIAASGAAFARARPNFDATGSLLTLTIAGKRWACDTSSARCRLEREGLTDEVTSPDGQLAAFVRDHNLWVRDLASGESRPLTTDGIPGNGYGTITEQLAGIGFGLPLPKDLPVNVAWSPDSKQLVVARIDESSVPPLPVIDQAPRNATLPRVHSYRYNLLGDGMRIREELWLLGVNGEPARRLEIPMQPVITDSTVSLRRVWWRSDARELAVAIMDPEEKWVDVYKVDVATASARRLFREEETYRIRMTSMETRYAPSVHLLRNGDLIWYSHRSGRGQLHIVDGRSGAVTRDLTPGAFIVHTLLHVDERAGHLCFAAGTDAKQTNPYFAAVYRVNLDGKGLRRLTPEEGHHEMRAMNLGFRPSSPLDLGFSPNGAAFVHTVSTALQPEVVRLRRADGTLVKELGRSVLDPAVAARYRAPEPFTLPAPEGDEPLYGLIHLPSDFDPARSYPVIDAIYNGQQTVETPRSFTEAVEGGPQAVAELGFVVVVIDARGTPQRSKAFHDYAGLRRDQTGSIADHVYAIRELAKSRPYMDVSRVGIYGVSNGGYATLRAMLAFPDFFKVGVSINGSHDLRKYIPHGGINWVQQQGAASLDAALSKVANQNYVQSLEGRLLLMAGGMDANAPIAATLGVAQALIDARKDFEFVLVPSMGHSYGGTPFAVRKTWDFFVRNLQGREPPAMTLQ